MSELLPWAHDIRHIPQHGLEITRAATPEERAEVAAALAIVSCDRLEVRYAIHPLGGGRFVLTGQLEADVVQSCVVTLEPVHGRVVEDLDLELWPAERLGSDETGVVEVDLGPDREALDGDKVPIGRVVYEQLAAGLDPYPRTPGAEFEGENAEHPPEPAAPDNPFAVLAKLKGKS